MHKELVTMPLEGFGVKITTDRLCTTLAVDRVSNERLNTQPKAVSWQICYNIVIYVYGLSGGSSGSPVR